MSNDVTYANSYQDSIVAKWLDILSRESVMVPLEVSMQIS